MNESFDFLDKIFNLLKEEKVFDTENDEYKSVLNFKQPEELKVSSVEEISV
jgi:hypothetical protein